jgi:hypothetical protein
MLSEPQDEQDADTVVEMTQLTTTACKKCLQIVDEFIGVGHVMDLCQKLKHKVEATMIQLKDVC